MKTKEKNRNGLLSKKCLQEKVQDIDISKLNNLDFDNACEKYFIITINLLRTVNRNKIVEFMKEYSRIIKHNNLPILSAKNNIDLYKHWLVNHRIIDDILYFAIKSKYLIKSPEFWDVIIRDSKSELSSKSNIKSKYFLIAYLVRNRIITNKNIDANINAIYELMHQSILRFTHDTKSKTLELELEKVYALFFSWSKELSNLNGKLYEMIRFHYPKVISLKDDNCPYYNITSTIYDGNFIDFIAFLNKTLDSNYILKYSIDELQFFYEIFQDLPQFFEEDVLENMDMKQSDNFYKTFFPQVQLPSIYSDIIISGQKEKSWLYHLLNGKTLRSADGLPIFMTKKVEKLLRRNDDNIYVGYRESMPKTMIHYALRVEGVSASHAKIMSRIIDERTEKDFWFKTMIILHKNGIPTNQISNVKDYISYRVFEEGVNLKLKNKKMNNLLRDVEKWHIELYAKRNIGNMRFPKSIVPGFSTEIKGVKYQISQIVTERDLFVEGEQLNHCVYSYRGNCINKYSEIFSLQTVGSNNTQEPLITIELKGNMIVQKRGRFNRAPNAIELSVIRKWAEEVKLRVSA